MTRSRRRSASSAQTVDRGGHLSGASARTDLTFKAFTALMDASGQWEVEVPTPVGRLRFEVRIGEDGTVEASYHGRRIPVPEMRTTPEGDGLRVGWTQQLSFPFPVGITVDALVVGDRLTGTATAGGFPPVQLEGRRVG